MKFCSKGSISSFGEERLFFKNCKKTHGFLKHVNAFLQVHSKVNIGPVKAFSNIFLLFQCKHVLIKKLLEFLITKIDTKLFKSIIVKDLKTSNIQAYNILNFLHGCINKCKVTFVNNETEYILKNFTTYTRDRCSSSRTRLTLDNPFSTNFQLRLRKVLDHPLFIDSTNFCYFFSCGFILNFSLLLLAHRNKVFRHVTHVHNNSSKFIDVVLLIMGKAKNIICFIGKHHVFLVINGFYSSFTLRYPPVVIDVVSQQTFCFSIRNLT